MSSFIKKKIKKPLGRCIARQAENEFFFSEIQKLICKFRFVLFENLSDKMIVCVEGTIVVYTYIE